MLSWNLKLKTINFIAERPSCCHLIMSIWSVCSPEVTIILLSCHCCNCWDRGDMEMARISAEPQHCTTPELPLVYNDMLFPPNNAFFETMRWNTFSSSLVLILIIFCTLIVIVNVVWKLLDSSHRCLKNITWLVVSVCLRHTSFIYRVRHWLTQSRQDKILELDWYGLARKCWNLKILIYID